MSTKTGVSPIWKAGLSVVGNPVAAVMTSAPGFRARSPISGDVSDAKATRLADEPELTVRTCLTPRNRPSRFSNCVLKRPAVSQKSSELSTRLRTSDGPKTRPETGTGELAGQKLGGGEEEQRVGEEGGC